jgi:hypothetical protein
MTKIPNFNRERNSKMNTLGVRARYPLQAAHTKAHDAGF